MNKIFPSAKVSAGSLKQHSYIGNQGATASFCQKIHYPTQNCFTLRAG